MVATLPVTGRATWTDRVDNWRVLDTDWVQDRLILRYAAGLSTMGEGTVYYDTAQHCLMVRNSSTSSLVADHACVAAAANLNVLPGTTDTTVTIGHKTNPGNGLVINSTGALTVKPSIATVGNTVLIDATGITLHTGTETAKLTTDGSTLHSDKTISAPSFTGNITATSTSAGALTATSGTFSGNVGVTGTFGVTGATTVGLATFGTLNHASVTGQHINLYGTAYGIGVQSSNLYFRSNSAFRFYVGGTHNDTPSASALSIDVNSIDVTGNFTATGTSAVNGAAYFGGRVYFGGDGQQINLVDTVGGNLHAYMQFFGGGTTTAPATPRLGYIGYPGSTTLYVINERTDGGLRFQASGPGTITLITGTSGDIQLVTGAAGNILLNAGGAGVTVFYSNGAERGRAADSFRWGKSSGGTALPGVELFEGGTIYSTTATNGSPNMLLRHNTDATAAYVQFANSGGGIVCELQQDTVAPTGIIITHATISGASDYRWKNELGPVTGALDRVMRLRPKRFAWKKGGAEFEGFAAHETEPVVPYLVRGEKDAVNDKGEIEGQGFNYGGLTALLTAAIQELRGEVNALKALS